MATRGRDRSVAGVVIDSADKRDSDFAVIALCTAKRKSLRRKRFRSPDPFLMVVEIGSTFTRPSVIMPRLCQRDPASLRPPFRAHSLGLRVGALTSLFYHPDHHCLQPPNRIHVLK